MHYKYHCGNETIRVWVWSDDFHTTVTVISSKTGKRHDRPIREDNKGTFFTWNKNKIYLNDWIRISMKELKERVEKDEWITSDDLCQAILSDGIENVRLLIPFNVIAARGFGITLFDGKKTKEVVCKIEERWNRKVLQNYKLTVVPVEPDETILSHDDFYVMDMVSLIREGHIKILA